MSRVDQPEAERVPVQLYVDEFETMATERFESIVAEGRRFGLGLCLSHQNISQLSTSLRHVLRNNVHTQIYFQTGALDATELAREITGVDSDEDVRTTLMTQGVGEAYLVRRGQPSTRIRTLHSPDPRVDTALLQAMRQASFATFARPRAAVEKELAEREACIKSLGAHAPSDHASLHLSTGKKAPQVRHGKTTNFRPANSRPNLTTPHDTTPHDTKPEDSEPHES